MHNNNNNIYRDKYEEKSSSLETYQDADECKVVFTLVFSSE